MPNFIQTVVNGILSIHAPGQITGLPAGALVTASVLNSDSRTTLTTQADYSTVLTVDDHPSSLISTIDTYIYGLTSATQKSARTKAIPFAGGSSDPAHEGLAVEGREVVPATGEATPWTSLGTITSGRFSGTVSCPVRDGVLNCHKEVRLVAQPSVVARQARPHKIGWVWVCAVGRSTVAMIMSHFLKLNDANAVEPVVTRQTLLRPGQMSVLTAAANSSDGHSGNTGLGLKYGMVKAGHVTSDILTQDSFQLVANQWAQFTTDAVLFIDISRNTNEAFPFLSAFADAYGQTGASGVIAFRQAAHGEQEATKATNPDLKTFADEFPLTAAQSWAHSTARGWIDREISCLNEAFYGPAANTPIMFMGVGRNSDSPFAVQGTHERCGDTIDPIAMPDVRFQRSPVTATDFSSTSSFAHLLENDKHGLPRAASAFGQMAARMAGFDTSRNPWFGKGMVSQDGKTIYIKVHAMNGGEIFSPQPGDIRAFRIRLPGDSADIRDGFTATLSGNIVSITRDDGSVWPEGTILKSDPLTTSAWSADTLATETRLVKGQIYETFNKVQNGPGLAVMGTMTDGKWVSHMALAVDAYDPNFFGSQPFSVTSAGGEVTISGRMSAGASVAMSANSEPQPFLVLPPGETATILSVTPAPSQVAGDPQGTLFWVNGAQLNPRDHTVSGRKQSLDQRSGTRASTSGTVTGPRTARSDFDASLLPRYPLPLKSGDVFQVVKSYISTDALDDYRNGLFTDALTLEAVPSAPAAGALMPPPFRAAAPALITPQAFDVAAIGAELPAYDLSTTSPVPIAQIRAALDAMARFNAFARFTKEANVTVGYEMFSRRGMSSGTGTVNYGRNRAIDVAKTLPLLFAAPGSIGATEADRLKAIKAFLEMGIALDAIDFGPDGAHWQFHMPGVLFKRWALGEAMPDATAMSSGNLGQFFLWTQALLDELHVPHDGTLNGFDVTRLLTITAVGTNTVTTTWIDQKWASAGLRLTSEDGSKGAIITGPGQFDAGGDSGETSVTWTLAAGTNPFTSADIGSKVWRDTPFALAAGDPGWSIRHSQIALDASWRRHINPSPVAAYRPISKPADFILLANALEVWHPSWEPLWRHTEQYAAGNFPNSLSANGAYTSCWPHFQQTDGGNDYATDTWGRRIYNAGIIPETPGRGA